MTVVSSYTVHVYCVQLLLNIFTNCIIFMWCTLYFEGMDYLHNSFVGSHGHLTSKSCVVDSRYSCKITDYGVNWLRNRYSEPETDDENADGMNIQYKITDSVHYMVPFIKNDCQFHIHLARTSAVDECIIAN